MKTLFIFLTLFCFAISSTTAQRKVMGVVTTNDNTPLPGVNVLVKNTKHGTITDFDGKYSITINKDNKILVFSFIGYETKEVRLKDKTVINVVLEESKEKLDEIVVSGYGTKGRSFFDKSSRRRSKSYAVAPASDRPLKIRGASSLKRTGVKKSEFESSEDLFSLELYSLDDTDISDAKKSSGSSGFSAGTLTAGEVHDFSKWILWNDIANNDLEYWQKKWTIHPHERYTVQVETKSGRPLVGATVSLVENQKALWTAKTDNTGKAELWSNIFDTIAIAKKYSAIIEYAGMNYTIDNLKKFNDGINFLSINEVCEIPSNVDIAFVVDATGSMQDEIDYLKAELNDVINRVKDTLPEYTINLGSIFYRDKGEAYLTKKSDLSPEIGNTIDFIKANNAAGGGDNPEAVEDALQAALNELKWSENAVSKIIFLILDAPPHNTPEIRQQLKDLISTAAGRGIRIVPVACSGIDKSTEYLMRTFALATNGSYLFLTDHSGVGNPHIEPTTDKYDVDLFNGLVLKTIYNFSYIPPCNEMLEITQTDTVLVQHPDYENLNKSETIDNTNNLTDTEDIEKQISWKIYPNPTSGRFFIEIEGKISELYICDLSGKIIQRHLIEGESRLDIDISSFPTGIYLARYEYEKDKWLTGKILLIKD